jgi:hypothetical protein
MIWTRVVIRAATLAVAAMIAVPAAGQALGTKEFPIKAFPKFFRNGQKLGTKREPAEAVGAITLHNGIQGDLKCQNIFAGVTFNETTEGTEKGFLNTTGYSTFGCEAPQLPCRVKNTKGEEVEGDFLTAESPPTVEPEPHSTEARSTGITSLPWTGELIERETGIRQVLTHHLKIWLVEPPPSVGNSGATCQGIDVPFEEAEGTTEPGKEAGYELAPLWLNGTKNGLKPSHEVFEGEGGLTEKGFPQTGRLRSGIGEGFLSAPKLVTGGLSGGWELITAM